MCHVHTYTNILLSDNCEVNMKRYSQNHHNSPKALKFEQKINNDQVGKEGNNHTDPIMQTQSFKHASHDLRSGTV